MDACAAHMATRYATSCPTDLKWPLDRAPLHLETSMPGVFAAGDVRHASIKRVASAVGEGAMAVALVNRYLNSA